MGCKSEDVSWTMSDIQAEKEHIAADLHRRKSPGRELEPSEMIVMTHRALLRKQKARRRGRLCLGRVPPPCISAEICAGHRVSCRCRKASTALRKVSTAAGEKRMSSCVFVAGGAERLRKLTSQKKHGG